MFRTDSNLPQPPKRPGRNLVQVVDPTRCLTGKHSTVIWTADLQAEMERGLVAKRELYFRIFKFMADCPALFSLPFNKSRPLYNEHRVPVFGFDVYFYDATYLEIIHIEPHDDGDDGGGGDLPFVVPSGLLPVIARSRNTYCPAPPTLAPMAEAVASPFSCVPMHDLARLANILRRQLLHGGAFYSPLVAPAGDSLRVTTAHQQVQLRERRYALTFLNHAIHGDSAAARMALRGPVRRLFDMGDAAPLVPLAEPRADFAYALDIFGHKVWTAAFELTVFGQSRDDRTATVTITCKDTASGLISCRTLTSVGGAYFVYRRAAASPTNDEGEPGRVMKSSSLGAFARINALVCRLLD